MLIKEQEVHIAERLAALLDLKLSQFYCHKDRNAINYVKGYPDIYADVLSKGFNAGFYDELALAFAEEVIYPFLDNTEEANKRLAQQLEEYYLWVQISLKPKRSLQSLTDKSVYQYEVDNFGFSVIAPAIHKLVVDGISGPRVKQLISFMGVVAAKAFSILTAKNKAEPRKKDEKRLALLGLPTDTKELKALIEKAFKEGEYGELFYWKDVPEYEFGQWLDAWLAGGDNLWYKEMVAAFVQELDPDCIIEFRSPAKKKSGYTVSAAAAPVNGDFFFNINTGANAAHKFQPKPALKYAAGQWAKTTYPPAEPPLPPPPIQHLAEVEAILGDIENGF